MSNESNPNPTTLVETTRGMTFYAAKFDESTFAASHAHCINDSKMIAAGSEPGVESAGFVTFKEIMAPDGRLGRQYWWVCADCFERLREEMEWRVGTELPTSPTSDFSSARRPHERSQVEREKLANEFPYGLVGWAPEEVVAIANSRGLQISKQTACELLIHNERKIEGAMTKAGYDLILQLLQNARR
jgi:hypothetical protein